MKRISKSKQRIKRSRRTSKIMNVSLVLCFSLMLFVSPLLHVLPLEMSHAEVAGVKATKIATTNSFTVALGEDGTVWTWGKNENYQLGTGETTDSPYPQKVNIPGSPIITDIDVGDTFAIALDETGDVWIWGEMSSSISSLHYPSPTKISELSNVQTIRAGRYSALALLPNGQVWSWGQGILAQGEDLYNTAIPAPVITHNDGTPLEGIVDIAVAGFTAGLALTEEGDVYAWGYPDFTFTQHTDIAVRLDGISGVTSMISGPSFAFFTTDTGVYAVGSNGSGQLGIGNQENQLTPIEVTSLSGKAINKIAPGMSHTLVLMEDGTVWGAGAGFDQQLAELGSGWHETFQRIQSIEDVADIYAGNLRSFAIKEDGTVWAWGYNRYNGPAYTYYYGLLGTGLNAMNFSTPLEVLDLMEYDTSPKPVKNASIEVAGYNHFQINYDLSLPTDSNRTHFEIYKLGESEHDVPLYSEYGGRNNSSASQQYMTENGLSPGSYEVKIYTASTADSTKSEAVVYDNGGLGYTVEPGESSLSIEVKLWDTDEPIANVPIEMIYFNETARTTHYFETDSTSLDSPDFTQLYPGEYQLYIVGDQLEDGTEYNDAFKRLYLPNETNMDLTMELLPAHLPVYLDFMDEDQTKGIIGGEVRWEGPFAGEAHVNEYRLYFENAAGQPLDTPILTESAGMGYYAKTLNDIPIPNEAKVLRMYIWDGENEIRTPAVVGVWDAPLSLPDHVYMEDKDPTPNKVQGSIHWDGLKDESFFESYVIMNDDPYDPYILTTIPKEGVTQYEYRLPFEIETDPFDYYGAYRVGLQSAAGDVGPFFSPVFVTDRLDVNAEIPNATPNASIPAPESISFVDLDPDANEIGGKVTWSSSNFDDIDSNELYFMNESDEIVGTIAKVFIDSDQFSGSGSYEVMYKIPMNTPIPEGAVKIGIYSTKWSQRSLDISTTPLVDFIEEDVPTMKGIVVTPEDVALKLGSNESEQLSVVLEMSDGSTRDVTTLTEDITYQTSDTNVVTVTSEGLVEAQGAGNAEVTVTFDKFSAIIPVQVEDAESEDPDTGEPDSEDPASEDPDTGDPDSEDPGSEDPDTGDPDSEDPGSEDPDTGDPDSEDPGSEEPGTPDSIKPVPGRTDTGRPDSSTVDSDESGSESTDDELSDPEAPDPNDPTSPESSQDDEKEDESNDISLEIIAAQGGTVKLDGFVEIIIPPHALPFDGTVSISLIAENEAPDAVELNRLNEILEIKSSTGSIFNLPITMIFDYNSEELTSGERPAIKYYHAGQQRWIYVGGDVNAEGKVVIQIDHLTPFVVTAKELIQFSDLADDHWAKAYVDRLAGMSVIAGHGDGTFAPNDLVTRAQFVKMIVEAIGIQAQNTMTDFADDAEIPDWAKPYVSAAEEAGIVGGYEINGERTFKPDQTITRAEMAVIISRVARLGSATSTEFSDQHEIPDWARSAIRSATAFGIISGYPDGTFRPHDHASRAESAAMIYLMLNVLKI